MLKKSASGVLASFRPPTLGRGDPKVGVAVGVFPFAKTHCKGERPTRSAVCTSSALHPLRPCLGQGAFQGEEAVMADSWREGEISTGGVRSLAFLSILRCSPVVPVPHVRVIEVLARQHFFPHPARFGWFLRGNK
jgi:hypothetical protein